MTYRKIRHVYLQCNMPHFRLPLVPFCKAKGILLRNKWRHTVRPVATRGAAPGKAVSYCGLSVCAHNERRHSSTVKNYKKQAVQGK